MDDSSDDEFELMSHEMEDPNESVVSNVPMVISWILQETFTTCKEAQKAKNDMPFKYSGFPGSTLKRSLVEALCVKMQSETLLSNKKLECRCRSLKNP